MWPGPFPHPSDKMLILFTVLIAQVVFKQVLL